MSDAPADFVNMTDDQLQIQSLLGQLAIMAQQHAADIARRDAQLLRCDLEIKRLRTDIEALRLEIAEKGKQNAPSTRSKD